jgi:hypothetical protein
MEINNHYQLGWAKVMSSSQVQSGGRTPTSLQANPRI